MCSYVQRPYTTGTTNYNPFLQTPIRDRVACASGSAEPYVIPIAGESAYLDLTALSLQLIILVILLVGAPFLYARRIFSKKLLVGSLSAGILYCLFLILATVDHKGKGLIISIFVTSTAALFVVGLLISRQYKSNN